MQKKIIDVEFEVVHDPRREEEPLRLDPREPPPRRWWQGRRIHFDWPAFWVVAAMSVLSALRYLQDASPQ